MGIDDEIKKLIATEVKVLMQELNLEGEKVFNTSEAASYLRVSRNWLYQNLDIIPHADIGGYKFLKSELDLYVKQKIDITINRITQTSSTKTKGCQYKVK